MKNQYDDSSDDRVLLEKDTEDQPDAARKRTSHDAIFKTLIRLFPDQLVELLDPVLATELDLEPERLTFLEQEVLTDFPEGERVICDL
ncbi:MAG: hypothetical protein GY842_02250, partial [bacterium]|nr:hypothetical protein [bacterium]